VKVTVATSPAITIALPATGPSPTEDQGVTFIVTVTSTDTTSESFRSIIVDFGDGTTSGELSGTSQSVSHVYRSSGTITVTATGTTPTGSTKTATTIITVAPRIPLNFTLTANPNPTAVGAVTTLSVTFENTTPTNVTRFDWSFGDGTSASTTGRSITHVYKTPATRTARVTVRTNDGNSGTSQTQIVVTP
jgi:PKD repeat protein